MFTSRSKRDFNENKTTTPSKIGPGAYTQGSKFGRKHRHSTAPFSSTSNRLTNQKSAKKQGPQHGGDTYFAEDNYAQDIDPPGPGSYSLATGDMKVRLLQKKYSSSGYSSSFMSETDRFSHEKVDTPGPGSYYGTPDTWNKHGYGRKESNEQLLPSSMQSNFKHKNATHPSIPSSNQSYGYEENINGELIPQKNPYMYHTGEKKDSVGPGHYYYEVNGRNRKSVSSPFISKTQRNEFSDKAKDPGPGQYETPHLKPSGRGRSVFQSRVARPDNFVKRGTPGVGEYEYGSSFDEYGYPLPPEIQTFGSRTRRFHMDDSNMRNAPSNKKTPGPGAYFYKPPSNNFDEEKEYTHHGPFSSTSTRFKSDPNKLSPGPGQYNQSESERNKPSNKSYGVFGTTSRRFQKQKDSAPGPGQYDSNPPKFTSYRRKKDSRMHVFSSQTERDPLPVSGNEPVPAPGEYELSNEWTSNQPYPGKRENVFVSSSPRFREGRKDPQPAPGDYDADVKHPAPPPSLGGRKKTTFSYDPRFKNPMESSPGPGYYQDYSTLLKRSFNATSQ